MAKLEEVTQELVVYNVRISRSLPYAGRLFGNDLEFTGGIGWWMERVHLLFEGRGPPRNDADVHLSTY